jgi:hypothetical protein
MNRRMRVPSLGKSAQIQSMARLLRLSFPVTENNANAAREVTQEPVPPFAAAGQEPSGNWAPRNHSHARATGSGTGRCVCDNASTAQLVDSTLLSRPGKWPQPPSWFCVLHSHIEHSACKSADFSETCTGPVRLLISRRASTAGAHGGRAGLRLLKLQLVNQSVKVTASNAQTPCTVRLLPAAFLQRPK